MPLYGGEATSEYDLKYAGVTPPGPKGSAPKMPGPGPMASKMPGPGPKPSMGVSPHPSGLAPHPSGLAPHSSGAGPYSTRHHHGYGRGFGVGLAIGVAPSWSADYYVDPWFVGRPYWRWRHLYGSRFRFYNGLYYFNGPAGWVAYAPGELTADIISYELGLNLMEANAFYAGLEMAGGSDSDDRYGGESLVRKQVPVPNLTSEAIQNIPFPVRSGGEMVAQTFVPADVKQGGVVVGPQATKDSPGVPNGDVKFMGGSCDDRTGGACFRSASAEAEYATKMAMIDRANLTPRDYLTKLSAVRGQLSIGCYALLSSATKQRHTELIAAAQKAVGTSGGSGDDHYGGADDRQGGYHGYHGFHSGFGGQPGWGYHYRYGRGWRFWRPDGYAYFVGVPTLLVLMALGGVWADRAYSCRWLLENGYPC